MLFDEPNVFLSRGSQILSLKRTVNRGQVSYRDDRDVACEVLFGDRVATSASELGEPLHRDLDALAATEGFSRARPLTRDQTSMVVEITQGATVARALESTRNSFLSGATCSC